MYPPKKTTLEGMVYKDEFRGWQSGKHEAMSSSSVPPKKKKN
jgi:hypothetical protein